MDAKNAARVLSLHNDYRRGYTSTMQNPANLGQALDLAVAVLLAFKHYRIDGAIVTVALPQPPKGATP